MISDRFIWTEGDLVEPVCNRCANTFGFGKCKAFPEGIPHEILAGDNDHSNPFPGDHGIQFQFLTNK